ncbi:MULTISPECIES: DUF2125 domain-containing protein [Brucella]|uniref:DUF2125 domain-containing protein n=15 Tax=Brucella TaxID=234 RepID=A0AAI8E9V3_BRUSS|nr:MULTISPECIES: DUF2125 domain-containing protein [Brucella]EPZ75949.1 hypothetical protein M798_08710 [Brucella melitensis ADMAS-G1]ERM86970.1 hypothetical protein P865_04670 [Brucella abortus 82]ERT84081.1 hypothetical protein P050_01894 [Brucella abortus 90-12178]ERU05817.1 hypothetical protein P039_01518 [Brucella abortus 07-0994-2411]ERU10504.1 hypothetical protein P038_00118 [Brucella abortus 99-9971-135]EXU82581.1 hypothetical protein AX23_12310 [Brucella melitensis 548]KEX96211.1 hy
MTYAGTGGKTFRKRTITLVIAVPVFIAAYTAGWFYIADRLEAKARADMARLDAQGVGVQCENLHMGGYPLRINVVCDSISWQRPSEGMAFRAGKFSSGSPLYAPYSLTNALTGPAFIEFPGISPLEVNWSKFTSNTRLARPFPTEIEIAARDVAVGLRTEPTKTEPLSSLEHMNVQIDGSTGMLKLMGRFAGLKFAPSVIGNAKSPELDGVADIDISDAEGLLASDSESVYQRLRGHSGTINQAFVSMPNGAMVSLTGPFSVNEDGLINADLKLTLVNAQSLAQAGQAVFPAQGGNIATVLFALSAMPKDENGNPTMEIAIRKGKASAGFIPLGRLPAL